MSHGFKKGKLEDARAHAFAPFLEHVKGGLPFLNEGVSDYEVVISASSGIEKLLETAIALSFPAKVSSSGMAEIFSGNGPLATFSSKIHVCCAFGLIPKEVRPDVDKIKAIRNSFAHSLQIRRFSDKDIASRCSQLKWKTDFFDLSKIPDGPKRHFISSCIRLYEFMFVSLSMALISTELWVRQVDKAQPAALALTIELRKLAGFPTDDDNHNQPKIPL